jgi:Flp pilus assembly protein TadG
MIRVPHVLACLVGRIRSGWRDDNAAQLVEFAVSLPLLVLFVVGIFDFSNAFTLKQKLTNVARDAARTAAAEPASDLQSALPMSVVDAFQDIDNYLLANNLSDCGVASTGPSGLTWTYQGTNASCPPGGLSIIINRGYYFPANGTPPITANCTPTDPGGSTALIATCISIQYAYPWKFGRVASLIGATSTLPNMITATAVAMNEN